MENQENEIKNNTMSLLDVRQPVSTKDVISNIIDNVKNGHVNPLEAFTILKRMAKVSEEVLEDEDIKRMARTEFSKYTPEKKGTKSIVVFGASISESATYTWYDFKDCKHDVLDALYEIQEIVKNQIKNIEDELKLLIPKDDYKAGSIPGFGIQSTATSKVFQHLPKLVWEEYGVIGDVEPPKKIQTIGLRYNKL